MLKINLNEISKKILDPKEEIIATIEPYVKKILYIESKNTYFIILILTNLSVFILLNVVLYINFKSFGFRGAIISLIFEVPVFIYISHLLFLMCSDVGDKILLKNTKYYITNMRCLSLTSYFDNSITVINLSFLKIDYFYFKLNISSSSIPIYNLYFRILDLKENEIDEIFQELRAPNFFQVKKQEIYKTPKISFLLSWNNLINKENLLENLTKVMPGKYKDTPPIYDDSEIRRAHCPG